MLHTLLLNSTYECIGFITERKAFKLLIKEKVDVIAEWEEKIKWGDQCIGHPAILKLKYQVRWIPNRVRYNNAAIFRRDQHCCQYCGKRLIWEEMTIDHVIPRSRGGPSSWKNCVTACFDCNNKKRDRIPEEANMKLLQTPSIPTLTIVNDYILLSKKHSLWKEYLGIGQ